MTGKREAIDILSPLRGIIREANTDVSNAPQDFLLSSIDSSGNTLQDANDMHHSNIVRSSIHYQPTLIIIIACFHSVPSPHLFYIMLFDDQQAITVTPEVYRSLILDTC